jgi:hypothetical protein
MIECVYYNDCIRCYRDGRVERKYNKGGVKNKKAGIWYDCDLNQKDYFRTSIDGKLILVHRLIAFCFLGLENLKGGDYYDVVIDHINRNIHDNRVENLRIVSNQQNTFNQNAKGYVHKKHINKYQANIKINQRNIYLGVYSTEEDAHKAYLEAKQNYHLYD